MFLFQNSYRMSATKAHLIAGRRYLPTPFPCLVQIPYLFFISCTFTVVLDE